MYGHTHTHVHAHTHTLTQPCFITSCLLLELLSSLEWAKQSRLYCVNLFVCQERLQRSLSLFVFGRGDGWRERGRGRESARAKKGGGDGGGGGLQKPGEPPEFRRMAGHLAPLWRIMTGCLAMTHLHPLPDFHPQQSSFFFFPVKDFINNYNRVSCFL